MEHEPFGPMYLSLHTDEPHWSKPTTELTGGGYARQEITWAEPGKKGMTICFATPGPARIDSIHFEVPSISDKAFEILTDMCAACLQGLPRCICHERGMD